MPWLDSNKILEYVGFTKLDLEALLVRTWFRDLRKSKGLSQSKLARRLDVTSQAVQSWESGRATPHASHRQALALELGDDVLQRFFAEEIDQLANARKEGAA